MTDVSCRVFEFFDSGAERYGYDIEDLVRGTGLTLAEYRNPQNRATWDDWMTLCWRFEEAVGGPEAMVEAGVEIPTMGFSSAMQKVAAAIMRPAQIYAAVFRWQGPIYFRNLRWIAKTVTGDRVKLTIEVPPHQAAGTPWFRLAEGSFKTFPGLMGLGRAVVRTEMESHRAQFDVVCPASSTAWTRIRRRVKASFSGSSLVDELAVLQEDVRGAYLDLVETEQDLRGMLEAVPDPVALFHGQTLVYANRRWRTFAQAGDDGPHSEDLARSLPDILEERTEAVEIRLTLENDRVRIVEVPPTVEVRYAGKPSRLVFLRDVTEARAQSDRQVAADRLVALGTLAAAVGHEVNNPLGYALGELELLWAELDEGVTTADTMRAHIAAAMEGLTRVGEISRDLQTFGRPRTKRSPIDVEASLEAALRLARNEILHVASVERQFVDTLPAVEGIAGQLAQVFLNLFVNAAHAMHGGRPDTHRLTVRTRQDRDQVLVEVEDTGTGISTEHQARLFEPFFSTKSDKGLGLGLAVCAKIVEEHGGTLTCTSTLGQGTTFTVRLPASSERPAPAEAPPAQSRLSHRRRVLVIDDEPRIANMIERMLAPDEVVVAGNASKARSLLSSDTDWDAILCDVMMPGETGPDLHRWLHDRHPDLAEVVVFVTGGAFVEDVRTYLEAVDTPQLHKPFRRRDLRDMVERVAARKRRTA